MKKILIIITSYILILCTITFVINKIYIFEDNKNNCGTMQDIKNDRAVIKDVPVDISICNLGSSHGFYGFDYDELEEKQVCFNFALPSQRLSYDYRILENYQEHLSKGATVFIVVSYFSLFGQSETEEEQFEAKNRRYYKFLSNSFIKEYDPRINFYIKYVPAILESDMVRMARILIGSNIGGDIWNASTDKRSVEQHVHSRYMSHIKERLDREGNRLYNQEEITALYDIIDFCQTQNITPILITTPYLAEYYLEIEENDETFFNDFYCILNQVIDDTGVQYYDYSRDTRFNNDYSLFINTDHLNRSGAKKFTSVLQKEVL